ncbi:hypothetical protein A6X21_12510 [Planctopirus hydrillae]|uniref:Uncharacterized protein n=1 Tax=Planctopirus hydrillae TaxID=1841610 RepID=A0A1C3E5P4_9PLAN|nr:hypothetical protein A6X21_12510 [Planctopirus hydrillae]
MYCEESGRYVRGYSAPVNSALMERALQAGAPEPPKVIAVEVDSGIIHDSLEFDAWYEKYKGLF